MDCSRTSYRSGLQQIANVAQTLKSSAYSALCKAGRPPPCPTGSDDVSPLPCLFLPIPRGITSTILNAGCPIQTATSLSDAYVQSARQLREIYESTYRQACKQMSHNSTLDPTSLSIRLQKLGSALERQYQNRILAAEQLAIGRIDKQRKSQRPVPPAKQKPVFNQKFVPLLEKYFDYNAYPSAQDRAALARKSMMTLRQIEVWFQNHRNRAKKEGRSLQRSSSNSLLAELPLDSSKETPLLIIHEEGNDFHQMESSEGPSDEESGNDMAERSISANSSCGAFDIAAPAHAFPAPYLPSSDHDRFPVLSGKFTFPPPVWARKPATSLTYTPQIDFDDFVAAFAAKLVLGEVPSKKLRKNVAHSVSSAKPWFAATQTITPSAPHPACIRPSLSIKRTFLAPFPAIPAPLTRPNPFRSFGPHSEPKTLSSRTSTGVHNEPIRRKIARLPTRTPKNPSTARRSPTISETLISPSQCLPSSSRTSSFGSDTSSDRRISSSSSSSSASSSTLTTPVLSPSPLPGDASLPIFDFQNLDDMFGDSRLSLNFPPDITTMDQNKHQFNFNLDAQSITFCSPAQS